jgi:sec-independent protein translocase protein TatA
MGLGILELALVIAVVVLLFGTGKLTRAMGDLARGVRTFRDAMKDVEPAAPTANRKTPPALPAPVDAVQRDQPARP